VDAEDGQEGGAQPLLQWYSIAITWRDGDKKLCSAFTSPPAHSTPLLPPPRGRHEAKCAFGPPLPWVDIDVSLKERQLKVGIDSFVVKCVEYDVIDSANTGKTLNEPLSRVKTNTVLRAS
jgi:hypothetical protein